MEFGFPKRSIITDRGYSVNYGGDGRYLWDIARVDKTVTVIDLASNTTVATIACPLINDWATGNYVPIEKRLYVHHNTGHYQIDLDPDSGTFCTILVSNSNLSTSNSGNVVTYYQPLDAFIGLSNGFTAKPRLAPTTSYLINLGPKSTIVGVAHGLGYIFKGTTNPANGTSWFNINSQKHISIGSTISLMAPIINGKFYLEQAEFDENNQLIRSINLTGMQTVFLFEFCPRSKRLIGGGGNASGWRLGVIDHKTFTLVGNTNYINTPGALAATGYQYRNVVFSPYTGMVYARTCYHASNVTDIHIYDCTLALASMYQGYLVSGADRVPGIAPYNNCTMGLNRLKNDEYNY